MATITFGSFPRSGNFFLVELFRKNVPSISWNWVGHNAFLLTKYENSFTVIRNPLECIPSWITYKNDTRQDRAEKVLDWYCSFYEKCELNKIKIYTFEYLINDPIGFLNNIYNVDIANTDFSYFLNETKDKSNFDKINDELKLASNFNKAIELHKRLCVPVG